MSYNNNANTTSASFNLQKAMNEAQMDAGRQRGLIQSIQLQLDQEKCLAVLKRTLTESQETLHQIQTLKGSLAETFPGLSAYEAQQKMHRLETAALKQRIAQLESRLARESSVGTETSSQQSPAAKKMRKDDDDLVLLAYCEQSEASASQGSATPDRSTSERSSGFASTSSQDNALPTLPTPSAPTDNSNESSVAAETAAALAATAQDTTTTAAAATTTTKSDGEEAPSTKEPAAAPKSASVRNPYSRKGKDQH